MKFAHNQHLIVCVDRTTGHHFHLSMPDFSAAEAQYEQREFDVLNGELGQRLAQLESRDMSGTEQGLSDEEISERLAILEARHAESHAVSRGEMLDRMAGLEAALAEALRLMEQRASTPAQADEFILPDSWPVAAADMVLPAPPPIAPRAPRKGSWKDAAAAVEAAEAFDEPLPPYVPPPEPSAADVFAADVTEQYTTPREEPPSAQPARKRLREAVSKARAELNEDKSDYDSAIMAINGNREQSANFDLAAKRRGITVEDIAREIVTQYRGCERATAAVRELNEIALTEMVARPGDSQAIVDQAIELIREQVGNATAYRT